MYANISDIVLIYFHLTAIIALQKSDFWFLLKCLFFLKAKKQNKKKNKKQKQFIAPEKAELYCNYKSNSYKTS